MLGQPARRAQRHAMKHGHDVVEQQLLARDDPQRRVPLLAFADNDERGTQVVGFVELLDQIDVDQRGLGR